MKLREIMAVALSLVILPSVRALIEPEQALPDLSIEGILLPYFSPVPLYCLIYPTPPPSFGYKINVTVTNLGAADAARFNVSFTVHFEEQIMPELGRNKTVEGLLQGAKTTFLFDFHPQDYGNYTLIITADSGNDIIELDETNNVKIARVKCSIRGDFDGDGRVGSADFSILAGNYGRRFESPPYPTADQNWDGYVGSADFTFLAGNYGKSI